MKHLCKNCGRELMTNWKGEMVKPYHHADVYYDYECKAEPKEEEK